MPTLVGTKQLERVKTLADELQFVATHDSKSNTWNYGTISAPTLDELRKLVLDGACPPYVSFDTLGRLALKEEAAGKIRVFAMVDAYTQWALAPLHRVVMSTLST